jgi:hypothetical protein
MARDGAFDFLLFSLPDNDNYSHRHGPGASVESIARADQCFSTLVEAAGGLDDFLAGHAVILVADHAQTDVDRGLPLAELLGREWSVLAPSDDLVEPAQLAVSPTGRAAHVYLLPGDGRSPAPHDEVRRALAETEGVDIVCWLEEPSGEPLERREMGLPPSAGEAVAVVQRDGEQLRFRPGAGARDLRGSEWDLDGDPSVLAVETVAGRLVSEEYPDPFARVLSALGSPHAGDLIVSLAPGYEAVDWGGVSHAGGGSHGSLHRGDSLGPLLFVGCGPDSAGERDQWALRDVAPAVLEHFGI